MNAFSRTYHVRGYEVDATRTMPLPVALSFLEQLRWEWIADPEWGLDQGVNSGFFFVVRHQVLELVDRPRFGETLVVEGRLERVGRSEVIVQHRLKVDERVMGHARVRGVWLGPNRRLARIPDAARELGRQQAETLPPWEPPKGAAEDTVIGDNPSFLDAPRRVYKGRGLGLALEDVPMTHETTVTVRPSDCDVFQHVNASQYLRYCDDARWAAGNHHHANRVLLDYVDEALAGETLTIQGGPCSQGWQSRITRDGKLLCAVVSA